MSKKNIINSAIILAGGKGTRLSEQTKLIPKPLVKVGPDAAIIHIIRHFVKEGVTNIYIAGGYKFELLAKELKDKLSIQSETNGSVKLVTNEEDPIAKAKVTIIDTGYSTGTAQRIKAVLKYIRRVDKNNEGVFVTYGDSFSDVDLNKVSAQWKANKDMATITATRFYERFGIMKIDTNNKNSVIEFAEKSQSKDEFINGGYIACSNEILSLIEDSDDDFSSDTLPRLQRKNMLGAYIHEGFWFAMDSQRDWEVINNIYKENPNNFLERGDN